MSGVVVGIHDVAVATAAHVLPLDALAERAGIDPAKFHVGLGQDEMSVPGADEDIVTMAADAVARILDRHGADGIRTLFFATESGVDQSKSAGLYLHSLVGLPPTCRVVELKQACYSATAALLATAALVARNPSEKVLVVASDIARYDLDTAAEPTQGAGAVALLVAAGAGIAEIEPVTGVHTLDVDDFWRPNDSVTAIVDGKLSIDAYLSGVVGAWDDFAARGGAPIAEIDRFCHHQPFTRMADKAQRRLAEHTGAELPADLHAASTTYNRRIGNSYTASLYFALAALLDSDEDLGCARIAMVSYGSGSVTELFTLVVSADYRSASRAVETRALLDARTPLDVDEYRALHAAARLDSRHDVEISPDSRTPFHFAGIAGRARRYRSS